MFWKYWVRGLYSSFLINKILSTFIQVTHIVLLETTNNMVEELFKLMIPVYLPSSSQKRQ